MRKEHYIDYHDCWANIATDKQNHCHESGADIVVDQILPEAQWPSGRKLPYTAGIARSLALPTV